MTTTALHARLRWLGPARPEYPFPVPGVADDPYTDGEWAIRSYQRFHALPLNGDANCPVLLAHLALPRCGHPDYIRPSLPATAAQTYGWNRRDVGYSVGATAPAQYSAEQVAAVLADGARQVMAVCGLTVAPAASVATAQIVTVTQILGPNILGLTDLPGGQPQCLLRLTTAVILTPDMLACTGLHEALHALGLGHSSPADDPGGLMNPVFSGATTLGPWAAAQLIGRYGLPATPFPSPSGPVPAVSDNGDGTYTIQPGEYPIAIGGVVADSVRIAVPGRYGVSVVGPL